jgi:thiamine-monophosphate kinase
MIDKESYFISLFNSKYIGDDCALIDNYLYSKDLFFEDIHFKREWMSLKEIAYKAIAVNISDVAVKNATPLQALIGIELPKDISRNQMREIADGFSQAAKEFDFEIVGGDTIAGEKLNISVTMISTSTAPIKREGLHKGDLMAFTGELGTVRRDLEALFKGEKIDKNSKFIRPIIRAEFIKKAHNYIKASLDISDGLSKDLSRLSKINGVGFEFLVDLDKEELCSGEEYEVLFGFDAKDLNTIEKIALKTDTPITVFAKVTNGEYESICKENHFE